MLMHIVLVKFTLYVTKKTRKHKPHRFVSRENNVKVQQEVSLKKIIVEGYRAVGSLNDSFQFKELYTLLIQLP